MRNEVYVVSFRLSEESMSLALTVSFVVIVVVTIVGILGYVIDKSYDRKEPK